MDSYLAELVPEAMYKAKSELLNKEVASIENEIKKLNEHTEEDEVTLEPIKKVFLKAIMAENDYLIGPVEQKRIIVSELLWNLSFANQKVEDLQFKSVYALIAKTPKPGNLGEMLRDLDSNQDEWIQSPLSYHCWTHPKISWFALAAIFV